MQSHCLDVCGNLTLPRPPPSPPGPPPLLRGLLRRRSFLSLPPSIPDGRIPAALRVSYGPSDGRRPHRSGSCRGREEPIRAKKKENVWSVDNDLAAKALTEEKTSRYHRRRRGRRVRPAGRRGQDARVLVSGAMLMEVETVLQTQEPVIKPAWETFASSISGIWKGVGAVFSPFTAQMEPIAVNSQNENLYDCYTLSRIEKVSAEELCSKLLKKTNWVTLNPYGETQKYRAGNGSSSKHYRKEGFDDVSRDLPSFESFDLSKSDVLEEEEIHMEPGLVFFEDGSYSRGPLNIPVGQYDESKYFLSPTFKFEQCLVKGCHKRLRIVHTIDFSEGGSSIQITRVAVYEEQWISPATIDVGSDLQFDLKPISQRKRTEPSELTGSWKVFEVSATPVLTDETIAEGGGLPFVYLCTETLKKRSLPESSVFFAEEEALDLQDVTVLWLPGGVTGYVDVTKDGILTIGVGWYSDEGINLVMERDYGTDGKLKEVRWKSELKRRWTDPLHI